MLISRGANLKHKNKAGETVLHRAADGRVAGHTGIPALVRLLIRSGADVEGRSGHSGTSGRTPLLSLALTAPPEASGALEVAQILLDEGADPNVADEGVLSKKEEDGSIRPLESALRNGK